MPLRVPYRLLRRSEPVPAAAVLLATDDPAVLLAVCARLVDPLVFPVAGGFLVVADSVPVAVPHAIRLRRLCENGFLPVDADLTPTLLPAEAVDLTAHLGLVFLPGGTPLTFDPERPLKPAAFLDVSKPRRQDWQPFPAGSPPAERLTTINRILPEAPDDLLASDGSPIGTDTLRPPQVGPGRRALGRVSAGLGKGLKGLGKAIGSSKLANLGGKLTGLAAALAPRLTEELLGKQEAALQQLLKKFREGSTDDALRHAVPVGEPGRGSQIYPSDRLPTNNLFWSLAGLFSRGISSIWAGGNPETWRDLIAEYRRAAQSAADRGDFRRAALIYARLLGDFRAAAETLSRGGLHRQAAIIYRDKVRQNDRAAHEFEKAGENDEALRLYRESHLHIDAGDLLRRLGEEELAIAEYHRAAERVISLRSDFVEAGDILLKKTGRADLAMQYFERGWDARTRSLAGAGNALPCAERLIEIHALAESRDSFWRLLGEAEDWLREPGWAHDTARFFNRVVECAELPGLQSERMEIRDRCRVGLAGKLREHVKADTTAGTAVADLFGQSKRWSPAVVSDADFALRAALKTRPKIERPAHRGIRVIHLWPGTTTAAVQATDTGELFVGIQEGAVVQYDPASGVSRPIYLDSGFPVVGLATDPTGEAVVALRVDGRPSPAERVKKYALEFAERHGTVLTPRTRTTWSQEPETLLGLLPVLDNYDPSRTVLVSTSNGLGCYRLPDLIAQDEASPRTPLPPTTHLKLKILGFDGESTLTFQGGSVSWDGKRFYIGWMPDPAPGSTLHTPPIAWLVESSFHVELAGLFDNATLYWTKVTRDHPKLTHRTTTYMAPGGFRAVAIWRRGQVIGVTATNRVLWLKDRAGRLEEWALAVDLSTPERAVACFPSRATNEVLVVLDGGDLARIPVPN